MKDDDMEETAKQAVTDHMTQFEKDVLKAVQWSNDILLGNTPSVDMGIHELATIIVQLHNGVIDQREIIQELREPQAQDPITTLLGLIKSIDNKMDMLIMDDVDIDMDDFPTLSSWRCPCTPRLLSRNGNCTECGKAYVQPGTVSSTGNSISDGNSSNDNARPATDADGPPYLD